MGFPALDAYEAGGAIEKLGLDRGEFLLEVKKLRHREQAVRKQRIKTIQQGPLGTG
jgi:hypothetical protein